MEKRRLNPFLCTVSILAFQCFIAPIPIGASQEIPTINLLYIPPMIGDSTLTTSGVILITEQTSSEDSVTATEEKKVKPQSEAPIKIMPSIRISEKD